MSIQRDPKLQHYVPCLLLKHFAFGQQKQYRRRRVWVFDKWTQKKYARSIGDVAAENGFYDVDTLDGPASLEPWLQEKETTAASLISRIVHSESLASLTAVDREGLALFVAIQLLRTPHTRHAIQSIGEHLAGIMADYGMPEAQKAELIDQAIAGSKAASTVNLPEAAAQMAPLLIAEKSWFLMRTTGTDRFYISDHPVVRTNQVQRHGRGNLGLINPGIEIYLPVSSQLSLAIWCNSNRALILNGIRNAVYSGMPLDSEAPTQLRLIQEAIQGGPPCALDSQITLHQNSLQVMHSHRFLFSHIDEFSLVEQMMRDDERYKSGLRMRSGFAESEGAP